MKHLTEKVLRQIRNDETLITWKKREFIHYGYVNHKEYFTYMKTKIATSYWFDKKYGENTFFYKYKRMSMKKMQKWFDNFLLENSRGNNA